VDCGDLILSPGFVDVQINGAFGVDFSEVSDSGFHLQEAIETVAAKLLQHGVTAFCPTIITSPVSVYKQALAEVCCVCGVCMCVCVCVHVCVCVCVCGVTDSVLFPPFFQFKRRPGGKHGAAILGLHLEGPFINIEKKGAHPPQFVQRSVLSFDHLLDVYGCVCRLGSVSLLFLFLC
jgi:N-acetylglucosamine-6-phosphate deacetylase